MSATSPAPKKLPDSYQEGRTSNCEKPFTLALYGRHVTSCPLASEYGTYMTVKSGLGFQVTGLQTFQGVPPSIGCGMGLVLKARRLLYHSTLGSSVIKKKKMVWASQPEVESADRAQGAAMVPRPYKTVKARFWPWRSGRSPLTLSRCSLPPSLLPPPLPPSFPSSPAPQPPTTPPPLFSTLISLSCPPTPPGLAT
jgi:hypothetical protein